MARKANPSKEVVELPSINEQGINEVMNTMTTIQSEYNEGRDLLNRIIGRIQLSETYENLSRTVRVSEMAYIKESKSYKYLKGQRKSERSVFSGTWEEFCTDVLKISVDKADTDINNLKAFGEEALESMSNMGIGYRELRQYRKLPEDQKTALIEVAKAGDKESLVELAEEFINKNNKEKELLKKQVDDAKKELEISEAYNADTRKERDDLKLKLKKYELNTVPMDERLEPFRKKVAELQSRMDELFEQQRQQVRVMYDLMLETLEKDPNYDPEKYTSLPKEMKIALLALNNSAVLTLEQARNIHRDIWNKFSDDIGDAQQDINNAVCDNLIIDENNQWVN